MERNSWTRHDSIPERPTIISDTGEPLVHVEILEKRGWRTLETGPQIRGNMYDVVRIEPDPRDQQSKGGT